MNVNFPEDLLQLGTTQLRVSPMGVGAWAWGDRLYWGFGRNFNEADIRIAFESSLVAGITFFDTAEIYGQGFSERLLGKFIRETGRAITIATKFLPYPWRLLKSQLLAALKGSLNRLGVQQVDLYQIHNPLPPVSIETWVDGLANLVERGLTRAVGVSNFNLNQMQRAHAVLARYGVPLASNQVEYSLLKKDVESNGLLAACKDLGITLIAYSPLAQGILTGKYTVDRPPSGIRALRYRANFITKVQPLIRLMRDIGRQHGGKSPAQVAINWTIVKGTLPIPGAKNARQVEENAGALGWRLSEEEMKALDRASLEIFS